jgi:hypothetical protein
MFTLLAYTGTPGVNAVNFDLTAAVDPEISQRNGHYVFSEPYDLLAAFYLETSALRASFQVPEWNQYTRFNIWPPNRSIVTPSNPQLDWWFEKRPRFSQNEEIAVQVSNNLGAATEQATVFLWLLPAGYPQDQRWSPKLPPGRKDVNAKINIPVIEVRANFTTATITANSWSGLGAITLEQGLRSGTYALVGCEGQGTGIQAVRWVFPRAPVAQGRRLRPGMLISQSTGDIAISAMPYEPFMFGEYGRFNTFELPQVEWWSNVGGAIAVELRLWLIWLSDDMNVQYDQSAYALAA